MINRIIDMSIKRILIIFIISIGLILSFSSIFGDYHNTVDYSPYHDPFLLFEMSYPSDWKKLSSTSIDSVPPSIRSTESLWTLLPKYEISFGFSEELVYAKVLIEPTNLLLTEYANYTLQQILDKGESKAFPSQNNVSISGYPGYQLTGIWFGNQDFDEMNVVTIGTIKDGIAYNISFYSPRDYPNNAYYPPIIDSVINNITKSFRILN